MEVVRMGVGLGWGWRGGWKKMGVCVGEGGRDVGGGLWVCGLELRGSGFRGSGG